MKKISVVIPCYNDSNSIKNMHRRLIDIFSNDLSTYNYEIIFVDDRSPDNTWDKIREVCSIDPKVRGVRNLRNFGYYRNVFAALSYGKNSDATFLLFGDLQDPPEALVSFVKHWQEGYKVVVGARANSYNSFFIRILRRSYYRLITKLTNNTHAKGVSGYGLYDKNVIDIFKEIDDIQPFLPGIIAEYIRDIKIIPIVQEEGGRGKSNFNFWGRYDGAMMSITSYTKLLLRLATFAGAMIGVFSFLFAIFIVIQRLVFGHVFDVGIPSIIAGVFFLGAVQLFFLGILGEYVLSINNRTMKRPIVVIDEKINDEV